LRAIQRGIWCSTGRVNLKDVAFSYIGPSGPPLGPVTGLPSSLRDSIASGHLRALRGTSEQECRLCRPRFEPHKTQRCILCSATRWAGVRARVSTLAPSSRLNSISQQFRLYTSIANWKWLQLIVHRPDGCVARPASLFVLDQISPPLLADCRTIQAMNR